MSSDFGPAAEIIEKEFPDLWSDIQSSIAMHHRMGSDPETVSNAGFDRSSEFLEENRHYAVQASDESLAKMFAARSTYLKALAAEDISLCAKFAFSNLGPSDGGKTSKGAQRVAGLGVATVFAAIAEGRRLRLSRSAPTESDVQEVMAALRRAKATQASFEVITSRSPTSFPAAARCTAGVSYYNAVETLSSAVQARFMAAALGGVRQ